MIHDLKTESKYFHDILACIKKFEVRKNDRNFKIGDTLRLMETINGKLTGQECFVEIIYILEGGQFGIAKGHYVMGIK
jgi:Domain of unknown function (DUF3850)